MAVSAFIDYLFFKAWERILLQREKAARPEEIRERIPAEVH
ncbi:MAG TPA: hypothetical protein VKR83_01355 [Ktedonobacteraceae bacterium]|nr:hypothetical protein [Ktedonobacteraceae bacterium]